MKLPKRARDISGQKFNRLRAIKYVGYFSRASLKSRLKRGMSIKDAVGGGEL